MSSLSTKALYTRYPVVKYQLDKKCLSGYLVYNYLVDKVDTNETKDYCGPCEKNFKERYNNNTASFRNKSKKKSTELSKYV